MALIEHLEKLRHFYKITQYKSINETSQKTGFSQAGLSKSLQMLELELGCKLFKRSREGLALTKEGVETLAVTKKIIDLAGDLEGRIRLLASTKSPQKIKVGMYDSIAIYFGIELDNYMNKVYPLVTMELTTDTSANLLERVRSGTLDLAVGVNYDRYKNEKNLDFFPLFVDTYSQYISSKTSNPERENTYIIHASSTDDRGHLITELYKSDLKGKRIHTVANFETLKQMVAEGLGIGILPTLVARPILNTGEIVPYNKKRSKNFVGTHGIGVIVRANILVEYREFILDLIRLGDRWIK